MGAGARRGARRGGRRGSSAGPKPGDVVLDAGAVLAVLTEGPGRQRIEVRLAAPGTARIDAVSLLDAMADLSERGLAPQQVHEVVDALALTVEDVDEELARRALEIGAEDGAGGLPLAGLCCVALGRKLGAPVLAADPGLGELQGVEVVSL